MSSKILDLYNEIKNKDIIHDYEKIFNGKKCCVVGNSSNLLEKEIGDQIDTFKCVIRFNQAKTEGFEKHVGSKTTVRIVNPHSFTSIGDEKKTQNHQQQFPEFDGDFIIKLKNQIIINRDNVGIKDIYHKILEENGCKLYNFKENVSHRMDKCNPRPSVGLVGLMIASVFFKHTYVCGFDFYEQEGNDHYFEESIKYERSHLHDLKFEKNFYKEHIEEGKFIEL